MAEPYRFGGPIPESVARMKSRRERRASSLYAGVKKILGERFEAERATSEKLAFRPLAAGSPSPIAPESLEEPASLQEKRTASGPR